MKKKTARRFLERNKWRIGAMKVSGVAPKERKKIAVLERAIECDKRVKEDQNDKRRKASKRHRIT